MSADFPIVDRNRLISNASKALLIERHPAQWELTEQGGGSDFGFDYSIQVSHARQVTYTFRAQLKGTESPSISADGKTVSIPLKRTTLNMFASTQEEVMLLLAVVLLRDDDKLDPSQSKLFWCWLGPELERLRGSRYAIDQSDQDTFTIHVPTSQELTTAVDVHPFLARRIAEARATETLAVIAQQAGAIPIGAEDPMQRIARAAAAKQFRFIQSIGDEDTQAALPGESGRMIEQALSYVRAGQTLLAEEAVAQIDRSLIADSNVLLAAFLSLQGKIATQRRRRADALALFEQAYQHHPVERHLLAREETRFLEAVDKLDESAIADVIERLGQVGTDEGLSLLVRAQVALRRFADAHTTVSRITINRRHLPRLVALSGEQRWAEVRTEAKQALADHKLQRLDAMALRLVLARACWSEAMSSVDVAPDQDDEFPITGAPGLNLEAAQAAWAASKDCLKDLRTLGWQANVEILAPIATACAAALGRFDEATPLLREAAAARPEYDDLQESVELLGVASGAPDVALEANLRRPDSPGVLARRSCLQFQQQQFAACLSTALHCLGTLDEATKQTPMALAMGSAAAAKLARGGDADRLMIAIRSRPAWREFEYFAKFAELSLAREAGTSPLTALRDGLQACPDSRLLQVNLLSNIAIDEPGGAREIVDLARRIRSAASLSARDWQRLIRAHFQLAHWEDGEREANDYITRFGKDSVILSLLAVAVEMQGHTAAAIKHLESALSLESNRTATLRNYLGLCLRLGRTAPAQKTIERLLEVEAEREARLDLLRLNALLLSQLELHADAAAALNMLSGAVNQSDEIEEGMFLNVYMAVTLPMPKAESEPRDAFERRAERFSARWPESRVFRVGKFPEEGSPKDKLNTLLRTLLGEDPEVRLRQFQEREIQARQGRLPLPFVVRPSHVFHYIGDVFTLWEFAKRSRTEDRQFHLYCAAPEETPADSKVLRDVPLLDLTALLLLRDLELFDSLFKVFPRVAIPRSTVNYISQNVRGAFVNATAAKSAADLLDMINRNLGQIDQPGTDGNAVHGVSPQKLLEDYMMLAGSGRWAMYSDDAFVRQLVMHDHPNVRALNTIDLMRFADDGGHMEPQAVGARLCQLARWNVLISVTPRYLLATLSGALDGAKGLSTSARLDRFLHHEPFAGLARAIWLPDKPASELVQHIGHLVADLFANPNVEDESVAAIWAFWFNRLRLAPKLNVLGWELLNYSLVAAVLASRDGTERRIVNGMLAVVEVIVGPDRMAQSDSDDAVRRLGATVGSLMDKNLPNSERVRSKLALALTRGTREGDIFECAYLAAIKKH